MKNALEMKMPTLICELVLLVFAITTAVLAFRALGAGVNIVAPDPNSELAQLL